MADISSTFSPDGGASTVTQVGGYQGSDYGDITDFYKELFRRRAALAQQPAQPSAVGGASQPRPGNAPQQVGYNPERKNGFDPVAFEEQRARIAQARAVSGQAPMRMVQGAGITPGYMPDVNVMSGAQRQMFLPQGSSNDARADALGEAQRAQLRSMQFSDFQRESNAGERGRNY